MPERKSERKINGICILSTPQFLWKISPNVTSTQIIIYICIYEVIQSTGIHYSLFLLKDTTYSLQLQSKLDVLH